MASRDLREFHCTLVNETVRICLRKKPTAGLNSKQVYYVKCDQTECQYVGDNESACPLSLSLFEDEIRARERLYFERS